MSEISHLPRHVFSSYVALLLFYNARSLLSKEIELTGLRNAARFNEAVHVFHTKLGVC